jgi:TonB family protein
MMIPRTLVPPGARLSDEDAKATNRRRPTNLDERTLVPSELPIFTLDGRSTIPSSLPLDSIAARVVVPRDVNVEAVQRPDDSNLPPQPTDMDERMTVPQGAALPFELPEHLNVSEDLVEPDLLRTGEAAFLTPETRPEKTKEDSFVTVVSVIFHILLVLFLIFEPKIFGPHVRTAEEEEIGRQQMTVLLPPGALDALKPSPPPAPHAAVRVDPKVIKKVAPTIEKPTPLPPVPTPQPEQPKKELPNAPVPQQNAVQPAPALSVPAPKVEPKVAPKLEVPEAPTPTTGLILPKQSLSPGGAIRDAERAQKSNSPVPIGGGQMPSGVGGGGGGHGRGTAAAGIQMLTDTEGIDFNDYLRRVYYIVKRNWEAVMPASVSLGDQGVVSLQFKITRDGIVPDGDPAQVFSSGKEPLDRAAYSSIRASSPFPPLPNGFKADHIELRFTYYYNLEPPK